MHIKAGQKLRDAGKLDEALAEFQKAYGIDPASDIAAQEIRRTKAMIERDKNGGEPTGASALLPDDKALTPSELSRKRSQERTDSLLAVPELRPAEHRADRSQDGESAPAHAVRDSRKACRHQRSVRSRIRHATDDSRYSIDLTRTTLDQALDQLAVITKSFWKPLSANTIFVTVDNPNKRREYAEQVVKVFYLSNVTHPRKCRKC